MRVDELREDIVYLTMHPDTAARIKSQAVVDVAESGDENQVRLVDGISLRTNEFMSRTAITGHNSTGEIVQWINLEDDNGLNAAKHV